MAQWAFLVGGLGTRLGALTADTPKPLLPVGGRPFIDYLLGFAVAHGADEIVLLAGYHATMVVDLYDGATVDGVPVRCSVERELLGTGGALGQAAEVLRDRWVLMNGDTIFGGDPAALDLPGDDWTVGMALRRLEDTSRSGVVDLDGDRVRRFHERGDGRPGLVNAGLYQMRRDILDLIPRDRPTSLETGIFPRLAEAGRLRGVEQQGYFLDIGIVPDYARAQHEVPERYPSPFVKRVSP